MRPINCRHGARLSRCRAACRDRRVPANFRVVSGYSPERRYTACLRGGSHSASCVRHARSRADTVRRRPQACTVCRWVLPRRPGYRHIAPAVNGCQWTSPHPICLTLLGLRFFLDRTGRRQHPFHVPASKSTSPCKPHNYSPDKFASQEIPSSIPSLYQCV
jgi:hypothetical protein